ncbi:acetyl esterase/lipase [Nocardioides sp. BE266]|uniref:alpha/beta hydrolase n=1 Tax=Nocardioides sp. BE266 TaxID=2817725 RepID=UPI0028617A74|nr:alpha/beta hydrolase [Nocardioides sp. BE266]MDR7255006.1 acetyl esterase/lipase [Nocardioides sp. BE266]
MSDAARAEVAVERGLVYARVGRDRLELDVYRSPVEDAPVVVYVHGGGWVRGDRRAEASSRLMPSAQLGVTMVSIDYRLAPGATFPRQLHDVKGALRWLRGHGESLGLDTRRLGIWGASAGGYLACLAALTADKPELEGEVGGNLDQPSTVDAVVDWFGPVDLASSAARSGPEAQLLPFRFEADLLGITDPAQLADRAQGYSLLDWVHPTAPPFLIAHGDRDRIVSPSESQALHYALAHTGVRCDLIQLANAGHEDPQFDRPETLALTAGWLRGVLT